MTFEIIGGIFVFIGVFFMITGSAGLFRFPDFFARLHAAGLIDSMGAPLVLFGIMVLEGFTLASLKIAILIVLFLLTTPTACHALAKAAHGQNQDS